MLRRNSGRHRLHLAVGARRQVLLPSVAGIARALDSALRLSSRRLVGSPAATAVLRRVVRRLHDHATADDGTMSSSFTRCVSGRNHAATTEMRQQPTRYVATAPE